MESVNKIICAVDFSPASLKAIEYAARIASYKNAYLFLLHVYPPALLITGKPIMKETEDRLNALCTLHDPLHWFIQPFLQIGDVSQTIVNCTDTMKADFIVMCCDNCLKNNGRIGSTATYVLEHSATPVILLKY
ncbi:MAG: hypothetical protein C0191_04590 [Mucilaginibacter sp.]|nr:MAG: hypothetical protein C0191_04590 [Mucilaginibacter sp.]